MKSAQSELRGPPGGADLRFLCSQPVEAIKTAQTAPFRRRIPVYTSHLRRYQIILLGYVTWQQCVKNICIEKQHSGSRTRVSG